MQDDSKRGHKRKLSDIQNEASSSRQVNSLSNSPEIYWEDEQPRSSKQSNQDHTINSSAKFIQSVCSEQFIIEHYNELAQDIQTIMDIDELSDVTIIIDNQRFSAHKLILAARSVYFSGRFSAQGAGSLSLGKSDIKLDNCSAQLFDLMLRYIYSGRIDLPEQGKETLDEVKDLMQAYGIDPSMQNDITEQNMHDIEIDDEKIGWISDTIGEALKETIDLVENIISINEENFFLAKDYSFNPPRICANYRCLQPDTLQQIYSFLKTQTKENNYNSNTKSLAKDISKLLTGNIAPFDVTLALRDTHFHAHKLILIARCPYFHSMFNSGLRESITNEVELLDGTVDAFRLLLGYIYSGEMEINSKDIREVIEVLSLAHKYDLTALIAPIEKFLQSCLTILNFAAIYATSLYYSLPNLTNACMSFIVDHSVEIIKTDEFLELPAKCLEPFMMLMSQHTPIEYVVAGLTIWLDANPHQLKAFQFVLDVLGLALIKDETRVQIVKCLATIPAERWLSYEEMSI